MTLSIPESAPAEGNIKVTFLPGAIADVDEVTPTEANNAANVNLAGFLMPGWTGLQSNQNTGQDRRFGSKEGFDRLGRITRSLGQLQYTWLPQAGNADAANDAYVGLAEGTTGHVMFGFDKDPAAAWAADDVYWLAPVECGAQNPDSTGSDEFAPLTITQSLGITGTVTKDGVVTV